MLTGEQLQEQFPDLTNPQRATLALKDAESHMVLLKKDKKSKHAIYSLLEACVSTEGYDKVSRMAGFANTVNAAGERDPKAQLALIVAEHTLKTDNVSDTEAKYIAERRFDRIRMLDGMTLTEFTKAFKAVVKNMETLAVDPVPTEAKQVHHFLMRLCVKRFGSYQTTVINALRKGEANAMPATINDLVEAARKHVPIASAGPSAGMTGAKSNPMVFMSQDDSCGRCGGKKHTAVC
jgi:hypothetical protein